MPFDRLRDRWCPPWRYVFLKNGKVFFWDAFVQQEKVPQKKIKKWMGLKFDRLFD